jgi:hypothetical protein
MINKGVILFVLTIMLTSCINDKPILSGTYFSYWYETSFLTNIDDWLVPLRGRGAEGKGTMKNKKLGQNTKSPPQQT